MNSKDIAVMYSLDQKDLESFILRSKFKFRSTMFKGIEVSEDPEFVVQEYRKYLEGNEDGDLSQETGRENKQKSLTEIERSDSSFSKQNSPDQGELMVQNELEPSGLLYQFSSKIFILAGGYETEIRVFEDHLDIHRQGRTTLPKELSIAFDNLSAITYGNSIRPFISFVVPGAQINASSVVTAIKPGQITLAGSQAQIPYNDPFSIVGNVNDKQFEEHYRAVKKIYDEYKSSHKQDKPLYSQTVINQESPIDKLKKLKDLADLGIISADEYEEKRQKLLNEI